MKPSPEEIIRAHGGQLRMHEALALGISRYQLYMLRDQGILEPLARGIYRLVVHHGGFANTEEMIYCCRGSSTSSPSARLQRSRKFTVMDYFTIIDPGHLEALL